MSTESTLEDLPDEVIQMILQHLGPVGARQNSKPFYNLNEYDATRRHTLQSLRLVNKRLSGLAELEQFRLPLAVMRSREGLSLDHMDIICKSLRKSNQESLYLAGSAVFFAGALDLGFKRLTWLKLFFSSPPLIHTEGIIASGVTCREELWMMRLRDQLRVIPLKYLELSFMEQTFLEEYDRRSLSAAGMLLGVGHPTLSTLAFEGHQFMTYYDTAERDLVTQGRSLSSKLVSLRLSCVTGQQLEMLAEAFGGLSNLAELAISEPYDGDILRCLSSTAKQSLLHLRFTIHNIPSQDLGDNPFALLSSYQNLTSFEISFGRSAGDLTDEMMEGIRMPNLRSITSSARDAWQTNASLLSWAASGNLLPLLKSIAFKVSKGRPPSKYDVPILKMTHNLDALTLARPEVKVAPRNLSKIITKRYSSKA